MSRKGRKQKISCADEWDVVYSRDVYCYLKNRPKNVKEAKRRLNKRARLEGYTDIKEGLDDLDDWKEEEIK